MSDATETWFRVAKWQDTPERRVVIRETKHTLFFERNSERKYSRYHQWYKSEEDALAVIKDRLDTKQARRDKEEYQNSAMAACKSAGISNEALNAGVIKSIVDSIEAIDDYLSGFGDPLAVTIKGITSHALAKLGKAP